MEEINGIPVNETKIASLRDRLELILENNDLNSKEVLDLSEELDKLILGYYKSDVKIS